MFWPNDSIKINSSFNWCFIDPTREIIVRWCKTFLYTTVLKKNKNEVKFKKSEKCDWDCATEQRKRDWF